MEKKKKDKITTNYPHCEVCQEIEKSIQGAEERKAERKARKGSFLISNAIIAGVLAVISIVTFSGGYGFTAFWQKNNKAIYLGDTSKKEVSLMINVYWGTEYIVPMLDVLDEYDAKSTFFVGGAWARANPDLVTKIYDRGHELGNHGNNHKEHDKLTEQENYDEITLCDFVVKMQTEYKMDLFAPPSGAFSPTTLKVAESLGYRTIMWSKDTIDWRDKDTNKIYNRATANIKNGDLVLMHPTENTFEALPKILDFYKQKGFKAVTVTQNIGKV